MATTLLRLTILLGLAMSAAPRADAWGELGHRVIARLAQENLTRQAKRRMGFLMGKEAGLADYASWADSIVSARPETEAWHSITVPPSASEVDFKRDCPLGDCVTVKVRDCVGIVRLSMKPKTELQDAFKMLVNLAGDLHQPLHAGYPPGQGGDDVRVRLGDKELLLFEAWEDALVERLGSEEEIIERVRGRITADAKREWSRGSLRQWTWETHQIAVNKVYDALGKGDVKTLDEAYLARSGDVIEQQLAKAAVRLAYLLADAWP